MGHWSEVCGVTGLPITCSSKIVMLIISKTEKTMRSLNNGAYYSHNVETLPIFGNYGDYGNIERIEEDDNTKILEEHYGLKIQEIADIVTSYDDETKHSDLNNYTFMFVRREIYDEFIKLYGSKEKKYDSNMCYYNGDVTNTLLEELGFKQIRKDKERERYNLLYQHENYKGLCVWSDETWIRIEYKDEKPEGGICSPFDLETWLQKKGFPANYSYLKNKCSIWFKAESLKKDLKNSKEKHMDAYYLLSNTVVHLGHYRDPQKNPLTAIYKAPFIEGTLDQAFMDWWSFYRSCMRIGIQFRRINSTAAQDGEYETMKRVGQVILNVCNEVLEERGQ